MKKFSLCILLPTYNEKENIAWMIDHIRKSCQNEIIVSDEHSKDGTAGIASAKGVRVYPRKTPGYGIGLQESLVNAKKLGHTHLLVMDCDRTYPISYIKKMEKEARKGYDLVNAGRRFRDIRLLTRMPNRFHTFLTRLLFGGNINDVNSGMKLMNVEKYIGKITFEGPPSTMQTITVALKNNFKVKEIMIPYDDRSGDESRGKSKIRVKDGFDIMMGILAERVRYNGAQK